MAKHDAIIDLKNRGLINNITNEKKLSMAIDKGFGLYVGFDPSFKSLHLGNYVMLALLKRMSNYGIKTYAIIGGATGMIGDPSGKKGERKLLSSLEIDENIKSIGKQIKKFANVEIINNIDFYKNLNIIDFLRDIGKLINVNYLLEKDVIKNRLETGISYTEFSYAILQGNDFLKMYKDKKVAIQSGGSDQWGNITTGIEMIRKVVGDDNFACGFTINLLTKSDGTKFGKSENGAIYLSNEITSSYEMYQFLINQSDNDVEKLLNALTFYTIDEIKEIMNKHHQNPPLKYAQKMLAKDIISKIHSEEEFKKIEETSAVLFTKNFNDLSLEQAQKVFASAPSLFIDDDKSIVEVLVNSKLVPSNRMARDLINSKAISINEETISNINEKIIRKNYNKKFCILKKGKKNYLIIFWK